MTEYLITVTFRAEQETAEKFVSDILKTKFETDLHGKNLKVIETKICKIHNQSERFVL